MLVLLDELQAVEIVFLMLLIDLLNAADRKTFFASSFEYLVEKIANDLVTIGGYPNLRAQERRSRGPQ